MTQVTPLNSLLASFPTAKDFGTALGLVDKIEEDKLRANLAVCKRHLDNHLDGLRFQRVRAVDFAPFPPLFMLNAALGWVVIPCSNLAKMNKDTESLFLSMLCSPSLGYSWAIFQRAIQSKFILHESRVFVWDNGMQNGPEREESLVIGVEPNKKYS